MSSSTADEHRQAASSDLRFAVVTLSDSRTLENDTSGQWLVERLLQAGYGLLDRRIVRDELTDIRATIQELCSLPLLDVIVTTGGTGLTSRDCAPEAVGPMLDVELPGFGELFRRLSYDEIGPAAMLSRALAGRIGRILIFCLPGSTAAVRLATEHLLVAELPHLVHHARR
jgi:molybdenum cofactor biosynthesis protein B